MSATASFRRTFLLVSRQYYCLSPCPQNWGWGWLDLSTEELANLCLTLNALFCQREVTDSWEELRETEAAAWKKGLEVLIEVF